jgi:hypothetical protein
VPPVGGDAVTVTVKLQVAVCWGCELSCAVTFTVVFPTGKLLPDAGEPAVK